MSGRPPKQRKQASLQLPAVAGPGLRLRAAQSAQDLERIAAFNALVHQETGIAVFTRWRFSSTHPRASEARLLYVEDVATGQIVSSLGVMLQTWRYEDIQLDVGEVELVGTHPDYRHRGLMRAQMQAVERILQERDCLLSCILGIPYFYRQFGYEYAIPVLSCASLRLDQVLALAADQPEPVCIRRMVVQTDLAAVMALYEAQAAELGLTSVRSEALWRYQETVPPDSPEPLETYVVEDGTGIIGYFRVRKNLWANELDLAEASVRPGGQVWGSRDVLLAILRSAKMLASQRGYGKLQFTLPGCHALVSTARYLGVQAERPYAWQVRITDHAAFLRRIAPALERRLAHSLMAGFSGSLRINCMARLLHLQFDQGRLRAVTDDGFQQGVGDSQVPPLLLTQWLLGYRDREEIAAQHLDFRVSPPARQLLDILFPRIEAYIYQAD